MTPCTKCEYKGNARPCPDPDCPSRSAASTDPLAGLPDDLADLLRDPSIIVPQDAAVFELVAKWMDAPSDTASALTVDEWRQAWSVTCRRMLDAQHDNERLRKALGTLNAQAIYDEAGASLEVLADLEDQRAVPSVEASDFRASLARIRDLALRAGALDAR